MFAYPLLVAFHQRYTPLHKSAVGHNAASLGLQKWYQTTKYIFPVHGSNVSKRTLGTRIPKIRTYQRTLSTVLIIEVAVAKIRLFLDACCCFCLIVMMKETKMGTSKRGTPRRQEEYNRNIAARILIFLEYSYYIPEVPCLGFLSPKPYTIAFLTPIQPLKGYT